MQWHRNFSSCSGFGRYTFSPQICNQLYLLLEVHCCRWDGLSAKLLHLPLPSYNLTVFHVKGPENDARILYMLEKGPGLSAKLLHLPLPSYNLTVFHVKGPEHDARILYMLEKGPEHDARILYMLN